jgi:murein DD-endopeptidase MepM/ murein hydrolase activator NlpD
MTNHKGKNWIHRVLSRNTYIGAWFKQNKFFLIKALGVIGFFGTVTWAGNHYVNVNTHEIYNVYFDGSKVGEVSNPEIVEDFIVEKYEEMEDRYPEIHMVLNDDKITYEQAIVFKELPNDEMTLEAIEKKLASKAMAVELRVDGQVVAVLNDEETVQSILEQIKAKYLPQEASNNVGALSADPEEDTESKRQLKSVEFLQEVEIQPVTTQPEEIVQPEEVMKTLQTGNVEPFKYTVQKGDCPSCIAHKFNIDLQVIYTNNPHIKNDMIYAGEVLDLTVLQPVIGVKTIEEFVEVHEVPYEIIYKQDSSMRQGKTKTIKEGKNGLKRSTFHLTTVNGYIVDEQLVHEEMLEEPVSAEVLRGTKVILGQGTGSYRWPVVSPRVTSSFGMRWGRPHKGLDMVGANRNILAADTGKVIFAGNKSGYGNTVILDHLNGNQTLYAHLNSISVKKGTVVEKGDKIGIMGNTGESYGVHLHFEIIKSGVHQNPLGYLKK